MISPDHVSPGMTFNPIGFSSHIDPNGYDYIPPDRHVPAIPFVAGPIPPAAIPAAQPMRIRAYARLEFVGDERVDFYIRTLSIIIGRRPPGVQPTVPPREERSLPTYAASLDLVRSGSHGLSPVLRPTSYTRSTSPSEPIAEEPLPPAEEPSFSGDPALMPMSTEPAINVDVDLGAIKSVSRDHARLFYDQVKAAWMLEVRGRNGVVVDGKWCAKGEVAPLQQRYVCSNQRPLSFEC